MNKSVYIVKKFYGEDFLEKMSKNEIYKENTRTAIDMKEVSTALQIVPKTILIWLVQNLKKMDIGESKEFKIPMVSKGKMNITKHGPDDYSGDLVQDSVKKYDFENRAIPTIGLCLLSTFELYSVEDLAVEEEPKEALDNEKLNKFIIERLEAERLIEEVKENKKEEKEAQIELFKLKLMNKLLEDHEEEKTEEKKKSLADFVKNSNKKTLEILLEKREVSCPSCDSVIISKNEYNGCICLGEDMYSGLKMSKSENGYTSLKFDKGWSSENKERLIKIVKEKFHWR